MSQVNEFCPSSTWTCYRIHRHHLRKVGWCWWHVSLRLLSENRHCGWKKCLPLSVLVCCAALIQIVFVSEPQREPPSRSVYDVWDSAVKLINAEGRKETRKEWAKKDDVGFLVGRMLVGCIRKPSLFFYGIIMIDLCHTIPPPSLTFRHHIDAVTPFMKS